MSINNFPSNNSAKCLLNNWMISGSFSPFFFWPNLLWRWVWLLFYGRFYHCFNWYVKAVIKSFSKHTRDHFNWLIALFISIWVRLPKSIVWQFHRSDCENGSIIHIECVDWVRILTKCTWNHPYQRQELFHNRKLCIFTVAFYFPSKIEKKTLQNLP